MLKLKKMTNEFGILTQEYLYFRLVYEQGSVNGAARKSTQDPGNLSRAISRLEDKIKLKLFVRHKNGLKPTEAGDKLYHALVHAQSEFTKHINQSTLKRRPILIGLSSAIGYTHFSANLLNVLQERHMQPEFKIASSTEIAEAIKARALDFAIINHSIKFPGVVAKEISREELVLCSVKDEMQKNLLIHSDMLGVERIVQSISYENRWTIKDYFLIAAFLQKAPTFMGILPEGLLSNHKSLKVLKRFPVEGKITALSWPGSIGIELIKCV